jgi:hypothetical protein
MNEELFKFPRTPHLLWPSTQGIRHDRVLPKLERDEFLGDEIVAEEKVDGANVGLSVTADRRIKAQSRGAFIEQRSAKQFEPLWSWIAQRNDLLAQGLGSNLILFGEWCLAVHSLRYTRLPDWFLGFDLYDRKRKLFWSSGRRDRLLSSMGVCSVPRVARGRFTIDRLQLLLRSTRSAYGEDLIEGLYLRRERNGWLESRAKIVRADFVQGINEHWSRRPLEKNKVLAY